jgi:hypothetical protein
MGYVARVRFGRGPAMRLCKGPSTTSTYLTGGSGNKE